MRLEKSRILGAASFLLLAAAGCGHRGGSSLPAKHLVLVVFDTLRADRMSLYGHSLPTTPFLESIAQDLLRFEAVKAPSPWTVPSHASIFTGLRPAEHRAQWGRMVLDERFDTLAEVLRSKGFCTLGFSSNGLVSEGTGLSQGFDAFTLVDRRGSEATSTILDQLPEAIDAALGRGCRLFLYINWMDTHTPYNALKYGPAFGAEGPGPVASNPVKWEISAGVRPFPENAKRLHRAAYDAAVRYLDARTADLLQILAAREILDDSLVVLTADHGEGLGEHAELGHALSVWEEQLAVPLLVRLPRRDRGGEVLTQPTTLTALMPSLLDWLGVARPEALREAPNLEEATEAPLGADYRSFFSEGGRKANRRMARLYPDLASRVRHAHVLYCGPNKLIRRANGEISFYNLVQDPREQVN
ncbi:MAG: sulfatase-like hydrolase/transferase, partial [Thermoanaerobaculia bacterium]